jgi:hypothetical protein
MQSKKKRSLQDGQHMRPINYLQTDARWVNMDYSASGEATTIGKSGCGPSCMAMAIAILKDKSITPKETCAWSLKNGYKAPNQGTYYSYFVPQGKAFDIAVERINTINIYSQSSIAAKEAHERVLKSIKTGNWAVCCMGKGNWTSSGHYILWYGIEAGSALINDPNSIRTDRTKAAIALLQSQVKYYWIISVPNHMSEAAKLTDEITSCFRIDDKQTLISLLNDSYNGSIWWVIKKLLACDFVSKKPTDGDKDIYRRTLEIIKVSKQESYFDELTASLFWVIKKLLDKLGVK